MKRAVWHFICSGFAVIGALTLLICIESTLASADTFLTAPEASQIVAVRDVTVHDDVVSGEVVNMSPRPIRDVQLLIRQIWHWKNEFRPGNNDPGIAEYYTAREIILPGKNVPFTYKLTSLMPSQSDGQFESVVTVAGFTQIYQPGEEPIRSRTGEPVSWWSGGER